MSPMPMPYALCPMPARAPHVTEKGYILLVTYKYLKTDARVRSNRVFSPNYFVAARGKSKNPVASRLAAVAGCISAKTLEGKVAAEYQEAGAILQGLLTLKSTKNSPGRINRV